MSDLAKKECVACKPGTPPLKGDALRKLIRQLSADWHVVEQHEISPTGAWGVIHTRPTESLVGEAHHLEREYKFANFRDALAFTNKVGALAESQNHHPDIYLAWGQVKLTLWTHSIGGLSEGDFIFAAKVDQLSAAP